MDQPAGQGRIRVLGNRSCADLSPCACVPRFMPAAKIQRKYNTFPPLRPSRALDIPRDDSIIENTRQSAWSLPKDTTGF